MDMLEHLMNEHREAEELMASLAESEPGPERDATLEQLERALTIHMALEERYLYPIVESALGDEPAEEAEIEHGLARDGLATLRELRAEPGFGAAVAMLQGGIGHHVREEEEEMFPKLRKEAGPDIAGLDPEALEAGIEQSIDVIDLTRDELYEKAQAAGIEGRSQMSKDELAEALQKRR